MLLFHLRLFCFCVLLKGSTKSSMGKGLLSVLKASEILL